MLRIRLFGTLEMECEDRPLPAFPTKDSRSLFCYLLVHRERFHSRVRLAGTFWPASPEKTSLKRLRTALWRIRTVLEPGENAASDNTYLLTGPRGVAFHAETDYWLDIEAFEQAISKAEKARNRGAVREGIRHLRQSVELYRGDLLEDIYQEWCLVEQERLRRLLVSAYEQLIDHAENCSDWRQAAVYAHQVLRRDPLREHVHRRLMRLYYRMGDRPAALQQFDRCGTLLRDALDVEPMKQTRELARAIREESQQLQGPGSRPLQRPLRDTEAGSPARTDSPRHLFRNATRDIEEGLNKLRRGLDDISRAAGDTTSPSSTEAGERRASSDSP